MAAPTVDHAKIIEDLISGDYDNFHSLENDIKLKKYEFLNVVESLGPWLTDVDVSKRRSAVTIMQKVLSSLPVAFLSEKEVELLSQFLIQRLQDHHSLTPPVILAFASLCVSQNMSFDLSEQLLRAIFKEVQVPSLAQSERHSVFVTIHHLLCCNLLEVCQMGSDFVCGFIQVMDGEKDPRNLVLAFKCAGIIASAFKLGHLAEEFFEVVACYFPVDFNPSADDTRGVSREQLSSLLQRALSCNGELADFCIPLVVEKLQSSVTVAKMDALQLFRDCLKVYEIAKFKDYCSLIWACIRREVHSDISPRLTAASLLTLREMLVAFQHNFSLRNAFLEEIYEGSVKYLTKVGSYTEVSCSILQSCCIASEQAKEFVIVRVVPLLSDQLLSSTQPFYRKMTIRSLNVICSTCIGQILSQNVRDALMKHIEDTFTVVMSLLSDRSEQLRSVCIEMSITLLQLDSVLTNNHHLILVQHFSRMMFEDSEEAIRQKICKSYVHFSSNWKFVLENVIPAIQSRIEDTKIPNREFSYHCLCQVSYHPNILHEVLSYLICQAANCVMKDDILLILNCLSQLSLSTVEGSAVLMYNQAFPLLLKLLAEEVAVSERQLCIVSEIIRHTVARLEESSQIKAVSSVAKIFLPVGDSPLQGGTGIRRMSEDHLKSLTAAVGSLRTDVQAFPLLTQLKDELLFMADHSEECIKCYAAIINKSSSEETARLVKEAEGVIGGMEKHKFLFWGWLTKALLMQGHEMFASSTTQILNWLSDGQLNESTARIFGILLQDYEDVLSCEMHAKIRLLYKQRLFQFSIDKLIEGFMAADSNLKPNFMVAVSEFLKYTPKAVLSQNLGQLIPLLFSAFLSSDSSIWLSSLMTIEEILRQDASLLQEHIDNLVSRLLSLSKWRESMKIRMAGLSCLSLLTTMPVHVLLPFRGQVMRELLPVLDDPKRLVRKQAVTARSLWNLLDDPSS